MDAPDTADQRQHNGRYCRTAVIFFGACQKRDLVRLTLENSLPASVNLSSVNTVIIRLEARLQPNLLYGAF